MDEVSFEPGTAQCDALGWETAATSAKTEILFYRGLSYLALQEHERAQRWLTRAMAFAEENQYHRIFFKAEDALVRLFMPAVAEPTPAPAAPPEVRDGLRVMRRELVGWGA